MISGNQDIGLPTLYVNRGRPFFVQELILILTSREIHENFTSSVPTRLSVNQQPQCNFPWALLLCAIIPKITSGKLTQFAHNPSPSYGPLESRRPTLIDFIKGGLRRPRSDFLWTKSVHEVRNPTVSVWPQSHGLVLI